MRSRSFFRPALLLLAILSLAGCKPELDYVSDSFVSDQATMSEAGETLSVIFNSESGQATLDLKASGSWTAEFVNGRAYWCTLSQDKGKSGVATLTFKVEANGEYDERSASVVFTCGKLQRTVVIVQKQHDSIVLTSGREDIASDGGTFTVKVATNIDYSYTIAPEAATWIHDLGTKGLRNETLTFAVDANPSLERRSGVITFSSTKGTETVTVYQKGEVPTIVVSDGEVTLQPEEGVFQVEVASNIDVSYEITPDCTWLEEVHTRTISTRTYTFAYTRNHDRGERKCEIVFRNSEYDRTDTVRIIQQKADIVRSDLSVLVPSCGATIAIHTSPAVSDAAQLHLSDHWAHIVGFEKEEGGYVFYVRFDKTQEKRSMYCEVYIPGFDNSDLIGFFQFSNSPSFSYSTPLRHVKAPVIMESGAVVIWGDGTFDRYEADLEHEYTQDCLHLITVEGFIFNSVEIAKPQDGMSYDFSKLRQ
ncbi:MAG: BACON domain-containing protein [Bacteroidales bacterium]|nr:BACON domain-containing protein [Bacteroidales bacterium]